MYFINKNRRGRFRHNFPEKYTEGPASSLNPDIGYSEEFRGFPQSSHRKLTILSFPTHHSQTILSFNATPCGYRECHKINLVMTSQHTDPKKYTGQRGSKNFG